MACAAGSARSEGLFAFCDHCRRPFQQIVPRVSAAMLWASAVFSSIKQIPAIRKRLGEEPQK